MDCREFEYPKYLNKEVDIMEINNSKDSKEAKASTDSDIIFVHTPKCKDCTPSLEMLKRRSCAGCTKFNYYNK